MVNELVSKPRGMSVIKIQPDNKLSEILKTKDKLSYGEFIKRCWVYIKENNLMTR